MIPVELANDYQRCIFPWVYDRIEVTGSRFTGPARGTHLRADLERPSEPVSFCLLGTFHCQYQSGPNLSVLSHAAAEIVGSGGFYGMKSGRRVRP
ncbi:hypothetical protein [Burkholderia sp. Ac-20365]|uniref:hypothetical protein n=1 Tax=Burkholderia sp. Ac-20365 TaxID=2703897 RepID=UPI00197C6F8E|nr:hypothetical protein [Burkholderia sp. Ac-20365]MBN3760920.1 hypothetical protein [Burkholderia sp. Ac-20365]